MKTHICMAAALSACAALFGGNAFAFERSVSSSWEHAKEQYSPPILANGDLGMLIDYRNCQFQDVPSYKFIRKTSKLYAPSIYRQGRRTDRKMLSCLGRVEERVDLENDKDAMPEKWSQKLDVFGAASEVENEYAGGVKIDSTAFISAEMPLLAIQKRFSGKPPKSYTFKYLFMREGSDSRSPMGAIVKKSSERGEISYEFDGMLAPSKGRIAVFCDAKNAKYSETENSVCITIDKPKGDISFFVAYSDDFKLNKAKQTPPVSEIRKTVKQKGWSGIFAAHKKAWKDFYRDFGVAIEDKKIEATYYTAIYNLKCWSTQWSIPIGILNTHWHGTYFGFTFFGPALSASGHLPENRKIGQFWRDMVGAASFRADRSKGKSTVGIRYNWQALEDGSEGTNSCGRWLDHILHMGSISLECMTYYRYTEDRDYLENVAYPVLSGCADFYKIQATYELADGRTVIGRCCDLERLQSAIENATLTTCAAIYSLETAAEAAKILGVDAEKAEGWAKTAAALKKHLANDGEKYVPYPGATDKSVSVLGGTIPYGVIDRSDKLQCAAIRDFEKNGMAFGNMYRVGSKICTWYAAWLSCAFARICDADAAKRNIETATSEVGRFAEIFEINEPGCMSVPWCSSPQGTYIQAVNEIFLQCKGDKIEIAPAVSKDWKNWSFKLRAYDNIIVEAKCENGKISGVKLTAENGHSGREKTVSVAGGEPVKVSLSAGQARELN